MEKHYVIRINLNKEKEQVFEGTLEEALELQREWGTEEEDKIRLEDIECFDTLLSKHFFGNDGYVYEEVSEEEYRECK